MFASLAKDIIQELIRTNYPEGLRIEIDGTDRKIIVRSGSMVIADMTFEQTEQAVNRFFDPGDTSDG